MVLPSKKVLMSLLVLHGILWNRVCHLRIKKVITITVDDIILKYRECPKQSLFSVEKYGLKMSCVSRAEMVRNQIREELDQLSFVTCRLYNRNLERYSHLAEWPIPDRLQNIFFQTEDNMRSLNNLKSTPTSYATTKHGSQAKRGNKRQVENQ